MVDVLGDRVILDHEPIEGLMPAMVMELAASSDELRPLQRGDRIEAVLRIGDGPSRLESIALLARGTPAPAPERRWEDSLLIGEVLDPVRVETASGPVTVGAGQGRVTVLTFLFTRCPVPEFCPLLATKLSALQFRIGEARIVAVTLDPEHDTPADLAAYGARFGADPAVWVLGRAEDGALSALQARVDVDARIADGTLTHALRLLVLDPDGRLVHRERDNQWDPDALAAIVRGARR